LDVLQANELTPMTRYTNTDDKDAGRNTTYTIGIITALEKEYAAVKALLKDCKAEEKQGRGAGRRYVGGKISSILGGEHNVILALADMGNNVAATRATLLLNHFPTIETVLMVGIAGGVPSPKKPEDHVRLGDVVISNKRGVVQYDMIKLEEIRACPIPPSAEMIESVRLLGVEALLGNQPWNTHIESSLRSIGSERPADTTDILFDSNNPEMKIEHPVDPKRTGGLPRIFLGPIASANELLKDPVKRDLLRDHFGVKAIEMEGSGIADATWISGKGYLVIRGICDYCDIHKNDVWQEYASAVAAGYAVALIESMPSPFPVGAGRIGAKRPSPSKGISIPIPERGTSTVTHNSEISSSQPPVPPKNPLGFFRLQVENLLKGNDEVTKNFYKLLASDEERVKSDVVADHLVRLDDSNTTEYPLLRLRRLMKKLSDQRLILDHSYRTVFVSMMDILSVASFPDEDRDRMENAMLEVLRSNPEIGSKVQLTTALPEDVKRLLILTRLKLASQKFDDFAIDRILNNDYQEGESGSPLFEIVRPVIIPEPFILPPDGRSITSYYAEKILETFNSTMPRTDFEGCLTHELKERKGLEGDGEVIALLLSNEASKNAQILQKAFPLLLVIVLQRENALRYDTVLLDRNEIEKMLKKMLRNPQK
jgi:nucleoside phosphorylase